MLTAVGGCHLSGNQGLPDPADTRTTLASMEVLAVDAAMRDGRHVCQSSSRPLYGPAGSTRFPQNRQNAALKARMGTSIQPQGLTQRSSAPEVDDEEAGKGLDGLDNLRAPLILPATQGLTCFV